MGTVTRKPIRAVALIAALIAGAGCSDGGADTDTDAGSDTGTDTGTDPDSGTDSDPMDEDYPRDGTAGWMILQDSFDTDNALDMLSFEWDYFMVHDAEGRFTGSVGYLIANPRNAGADGAADLVPEGGNVAFAGRFGGGGFSSEYRNWGLDVFSASATERAFDAADAPDAGTGYYARMTPVEGTDLAPAHLLLEGEMERFAWSLSVRHDWPALFASDDAFVPVTGADIGALSPEDEVWTVYMVWPRTIVEGTITDRDTGETIAVSGHGYREDSGGRWAFASGGWDFATVSDDAASVMWAWQSYHQASTQLDYLDVGFVEDGEVRLVTFRADDGELGWQHGAWTFDAAARQCVPLDTVVVAENAGYRVEADVALDDQVPILSDLTEATKAFVIMAQFPIVSGTIVRLADGATVASFEGQGGGEFANARQSEGVTSMTDEECAAFGAAFSSPLP